MTSSRLPKKHPDSAFRAIGDEGGLVVLPGRAEVKVLNAFSAHADRDELLWWEGNTLVPAESAKLIVGEHPQGF